MIFDENTFGRRLRIASAGAGYFAQFHLKAWRRLSDEGLIEHVGLIDQDTARLEDAKHRFGTLNLYTDVGEMLDHTRPDVLDIVTPPDTHRDLIALAAARGVTCICQKPIAATYSQAVEIVGLAESSRTALIIHENFRWMPWFREMKSWIDSGALGQPHSIAVRMRPGDGQGPAAYMDRQPYFQTMERFLVHETLVHYIDAFRFLLGEVVQVSAQLRRLNPAIRGEDAGYVALRFDSGVTAFIDASRCNDHVAANPRLTMGEQWLEGSLGVLRLDGDGRLFWKPHREDEQEHPYNWSNTDFGGDCVYEQQRHIVLSLLQGLNPVNTGRKYLRNIEIEEAIYHSNEELKVITV